VPENHWRLQVTRRVLAPLSALLPETAGVADDLDDWLDREDIPDGVPFLISPDLEYDVDLNRYFLRPALVGASPNTQKRPSPSATTPSSARPAPPARRHAGSRENQP
jgi:hypothetical protein